MAAAVLIWLCVGATKQACEAGTSPQCAYSLDNWLASSTMSGRLSPDGKILVMGTQKGTEVAYIQSGFRLWAESGSAWVYDAVLSPDSRYVAIATGEGGGQGTKVVDLVDMTTVWYDRSPPAIVWQVTWRATFAVDYSPDGTKLIAGHNDGSIDIHDASSGAVVKTLTGGQAGLLRRVRYSPDGTLIVSAVRGGTTAGIWDAASGNLLHSLSHGDQVWDVRVSPDSTLVASTSVDRTVVIWKTDGTKVRTLTVSASIPFYGLSLVFSRDGARLFVGVYGSIQEWDVSTGTKLSTLEVSPKNGVRDLTLSPDGSTMVSALDATPTYLVWDFSTPAPALPTSAPSTPAPATPVPPTSAPATAVPSTPVPPTSVPETSVPLTPGPPTPSPPTPAPPTPAPATDAPPTLAPLTPAPPTAEPQTIVPAPPTAAPATPSPPTPAPATDAPATPAPLTLPVQTTAPATTAPANTTTPAASGTPAPPTAAPPTAAPATPSPPTPAPPTPSPAPTPVPATDAPATPAPATLAAVTTAPATTGPAGTAAPAAATTPAASGTPATLPADTPVPKASSAPPPVTATPEPAAVPLNDTCLAESQADCEALPLCVWDTAAPQCKASFDCTRVADTLCAQTEGCVWDADAAVCRAAAPRHGSSSSTCTLCWVLPVCGAALLLLCAAAFLLFCRKQKPRHRLELETFGKGDLFDAALMEMGGADQAPEEQGNPSGMDDDVTLLE